MLEEVYGQGLVWADALGARWAEASLLEHWARNLFLVPYAHGTTSWLQSLDTHEHSQLKSVIRAAKSQLSYELQKEYEAECDDYTKHPWGPPELLVVLSKSLKAFKAKYPNVALQGPIDNQILALRPTRHEGLRLLEECPEQTTQQLLEIPGIKRRPPGKGISMEWVERRDQAFDELPANEAEPHLGREPPEPDWDALENNEVAQDDMAKKPEDEREFEGKAVWVEFECGLQDLALSEEQRLMLLPVEARLQATARTSVPVIRKAATKQTRRKRRNRWVRTFKDAQTGHSRTKWRKKLAGGQKLEDLRQGAGPVAKKRAAPKPKGRPAKAHAKAKAKEQAAGKFALKNAAAKAAAQGAAEKAGARRKARTEVEIEPFPPKAVRVTDEAAGETLLGRAGVATRAFQVTCPESQGEFIEWSILEDNGKDTIFRARAVWCSERFEKNEKAPTRMFLDYRTLKVTKRNEIAKALDCDGSPENLELIEWGQQIEWSTLRAAFIEMMLRFQDLEGEVQVLHPGLVHSLGHRDGLPKGPADPGQEYQKHLQKLKEAKVVIFAVHEGNHYTYLELNRDDSGYRAVYKDSWPSCQVSF